MLRVVWQGLWGSGRGPALRLAPQTRILIALLLLATCLLAPVLRWPGLACIVGGTWAWLSLCGTRPRDIGKVALLGLAFLLPAFLLTPLIDQTTPAADWTWGSALAIPASLLIRGLSVMLITLGKVTALSASELREGLLRLPVPRHVATILIQILHQAETLVDETRQVAAAMAVRSAAGTGRTAWRMLASLPRVWLPRVVIRAGAVAAAMEIRGYGQDSLPSFRAVRPRARDAFAILLAGGLLGGVIALRWRAVR